MSERTYHVDAYFEWGGWMKCYKGQTKEKAIALANNFFELNPHSPAIKVRVRADRLRNSRRNNENI